MLPDYISKAVPNPSSNRAPWYKNTAPTYAGVFLWVVFYREIANGTLDKAGVGLCLLALLIGGLISYGLFYYVPALMGMRTGYPLYVVGSSTFGTQGGYLMPGLLMGLLQVGWMSVNAFVATSFILTAFGSQAGPGTFPFAVIATIWALGLKLRRRERYPVRRKVRAVPEYGPAADDPDRVREKRHRRRAVCAGASEPLSWLHDADPSCGRLLCYCRRRGR